VSRPTKFLQIGPFFAVCGTPYAERPLDLRGGYV
jgi:hypothetical protein